MPPDDGPHGAPPRTDPRDAASANGSESLVTLQITLDGSNLSLQQLANVARQGAKVRVAAGCYEAIRRSRAVVERRVEGRIRTYGVNTGFGALRDETIGPEDLNRLQENIVLSHSAGVGPELGPDEVRAMMVLRANTLLRGRSGVRPEVVDALVHLINAGVIPVVPRDGSVGSSGDLAPLAHLALVLIGRGVADFDGNRRGSGSEALGAVGLEPLTLEAKEGLAVTNGTQFMSAVGGLALWDALLLLEVADIAGTMTLEALMGARDAFDPALQDERPYEAQIASAATIRKLTEGSELLDVGSDVQDAYSVRCIPQVHGAVGSTLAFVKSMLEVEFNSANDNPLVFADEEGPSGGRVLSGGNFHGEPVALVLDFLAAAVAELGSISERRTARLLDDRDNRKLPRFLVENSGLNSGFMIAQYTAAALASRNKTLAHPSAVDSIPTSANQEDHNSMGATSAVHAREIVDNVRTILAIEVLCACQALDFRKAQGLSPGRGVEAALRTVRRTIPHMGSDRELAPDIAEASRLVADGTLVSEVRRSADGVR